MYQVHNEFAQPPDENEKIWRYMDFTKFVALLESSALYFARSDMLGDPFEGSYPRSDVEARKLNPEEYPDKHRKLVEAGMESLANHISSSNRQALEWVAINCWHLNNFESTAMWKLYLKSDEGVAIQSSYKKLKHCFFAVAEPIFLGRVKYINYETDRINQGIGNVRNMMTPFVHKRMSFEHEKEVRAVIVRYPNEQDASRESGWKETISHGINVPVDLNGLIEMVHVAPGSPAWVTELVRSTIKRFGYKFSVTQSNLDQISLY